MDEERAGRAELDARFVVCVLATFVACWIAFLLIGRYGRNVPRWDEWENVPYVVGERAVTLEWLWEAHGQHRFPLPRAVYLLVMSLFGDDFRAGMYVNVLVLGAASLCLTLVARRARGASSWTDLVFPLSLLHWGHADNLLWGFQIGFVLSTAFYCFALAGIASLSRAPSLRAILVTGSFVSLLPLVGGTGLLTALAFVPFLAWLAFSRSRENRPLEAATALVLALAAVGVAVLYTRGLGVGLDRGESGGALAVVEGTLSFLALGFGPSAGGASLAARVLAVAFVVCAGFVLLRRMRRGFGLGDLGLSCALVSMVVLAAGISWGRGTGSDVAHPPRYVTLAAPLCCCLHLVFSGVNRGRLERAASWALFVVLAVVLPTNVERGVRIATDLSDRLGDFEEDAWSGLTPRELAARHTGLVYPVQGVLNKGIRLLREHRLGPYAVPPERWSARLRRRYSADLWSHQSRPWIPVLLEGVDEQVPGFAMLAPAPSTIGLRVPPGTWRLTGQLGLRRDAWTIGRSDGVEFRILLGPGRANMQEIFAASLDPARREADRGPRTFELEFEVESPSELTFETGPGAAGDHEADWSYWSGIVLSPR